jgi:hypothetical protein
MNNMQTTQPVTNVPKHVEMESYDRLPVELRYKLAYAPIKISATSSLKYLETYPLSQILGGIDHAIDRFHCETKTFYP